MSWKLSLMIAVSTNVLAAMAVSEACPPGVAVHVDQPTLPWSSRSSNHPPPRITARTTPPPRARVSLRDGTPGAHAIVRTVGGGELACGKGHGMVTVRVARGQVTVLVDGFDPKTASCIARAIEALRFPRVEDEIARISVEL